MKCKLKQWGSAAISKYEDAVVETPKKTIGLSILALLLIGGMMWYGMWQFSRWWNYTWGYSSYVRTEVCEMIKNGVITKGENWKQYCK